MLLIFNYKTSTQNPMKKLFLFLPFLWIACNTPVEQAVKEQPVLSQAEAENIAKGLIQGSFDDIWSAMDSAKIKKYHTDDFLICENGMVWNNDSIVSYQNNVKLKGAIPDRKNRFEFIEVKPSNEMIWMAYHNFATISENGAVVAKPTWLESAVAIKQNEEWKLQMLHSTYTGNQ